MLRGQRCEQARVTPSEDPTRVATQCRDESADSSLFATKAPPPGRPERPVERGTHRIRRSASAAEGWSSSQGVGG
jgi:hypothetical protein